MLNPWLLLIVGVGVIALAAAWPSWRTRKAMARPFPEAWERHLRNNMSVFNVLPDMLQDRLRRHVQRFLFEKHFSGAGGLELDDEIRVTIAGEACLLILGREGVSFPGLRYIIVYPTTFLRREDLPDWDGVVDQEHVELLGESWGNGRVILAWDSVLHGVRSMDDGKNVVLHEFAHQLDSESGSTDGAPLLGDAPALRQWAATFTQEYEQLLRDLRRNEGGVLDPYAASNPAEFFAVATETFFEKPADLQRHHPELFAMLKTYYELDPRTWHSPAT